MTMKGRGKFTAFAMGVRKGKVAKLWEGSSDTGRLRGGAHPPGWVSGNCKAGRHRNSCTNLSCACSCHQVQP